MISFGWITWLLTFPALMKSALDDPGIPQQVAEVANDKQEWEICGIIDKEDVDGVPHYWVQWSPTLVPKYEMGKVRALVARFEAQLSPLRYYNLLHRHLLLLLIRRCRPLPPLLPALLRLRRRRISQHRVECRCVMHLTTSGAMLAWMDRTKGSANVLHIEHNAKIRDRNSHRSPPRSRARPRTL